MITGNEIKVKAQNQFRSYTLGIKLEIIAVARKNLVDVELETLSQLSATHICPCTPSNLITILFSLHSTSSPLHPFRNLAQQLIEVHLGSYRQLVQIDLSSTLT